VLTGPTADGWAVYLTDGREVARYRGIGAKRRALRHVARLAGGRSSMAPEPPEHARHAPRAPDRASAQGHALHETFFVGRRPFEAPELYAVTTSTVERLRSERAFETPQLDWHTADAASMELGHTLLGRLADETPSPQLVERFVVDVLARLPADGFVLGSEEIWLWIHWASAPRDWSTTVPQRRRSWLDRLRSVARGGGS
jgi:hypothetical protein